MPQPLLGAAATALVVAVSLAFIALFDFATFSGWVSFFMLSLIPMQIVIVVIWGANPAFVGRFAQPAKGAVLVLVTIAAGVVLAPLALRAAGEGVGPPGPIPSHYVIAVVPTTFWLAIMWGGWPFRSMSRDPVPAGIALLAAAYVITYVVFRVFFNYDFMQGAPVYLASAPAGLYDAVTALVFYVTALAVMFLVLCFDLWPFTTAPALMRQPILGIVWTGVTLAGAALAMYVGVGLGGMDPMIFLIRVTAPVIFGAIVVLNMLQGSLFAAVRQPAKGVLTVLAAAVVGVALAALYGTLAPLVTGSLPSGPPGYEYEVWLANALLSVTFPFLIFYAVFFEYWPLGAKARG